MVSLDWQHGDYLGTLEDGRGPIWSASSYNKDLHLSHGHGKYLIDAQGIHFHLMHSGETFIPYELIKKIELCRRHAGKYTVGDYITKITWTNVNRVVVSGFVFAKNDAENAQLHQQIKQYMESRQ